MKKFNIRDFSTSHGGYLNNQKLQFANEIARHKLMDIIGDLTLTGFPINAKILASRPGHATNVAFAKKIKQMVLKKPGGRIPAGPLVSL
jgi:UDP-3-O-[3-hydroxymyristoyl] N-acetylglucosamine deacetylase/3-hydroxyacyl-[acyl-carrier-protein] dehydratase